jgi:hypothetical protein
MSDMGFTPNLTATDAVYPFRFVEISGIFSGAHCQEPDAFPVGVSDGSVYQFNQVVHAPIGYQITLQPSNTVQIQIGAGGINVGQFIMSDGEGRGIAQTGANSLSTYQALESGTEGSIIRAFRIGSKKL